jgi:hypothetical protein
MRSVLLLRYSTLCDVLYTYALFPVRLNTAVVLCYALSDYHSPPRLLKLNPICVQECV